MVNYNETLMWKEINESVSVLPKIMEKNLAVMDKLTEKLNSSNVSGIYAVARGTSNHALVYFKYAEEILAGLPVALGAPSIVSMYNGKINLKNQLVIGCSQSGKAEDVISVIKRAKEQGGITVAITNDDTSPLAKVADYHLCCYAEEEKSVAATKTFNAQLFIAIWLAYKIANKPLDDIMGLLANYPSVFERADKLTDLYSDKYTILDNGFVLGRGFCYSLALEATLKLQETGYAQIKGYASSDFYHGPMAMVNQNTPIIIYASDNNMGDGLDDARLEDEIKSIDKMISLKARVLLVTDSQKLYDKYNGDIDVALMQKAINDAFSVFNFAVFAQMLACKISCKKGLNPDSPRALNKITITK